LIRFRIVEEVCLRDYETVNHLIWHCERLETEKLSPTDALTTLDGQLGTPLHGFVCSEEVAAMKCTIWISSEVLELKFDDLVVLFQR
jgi:hypothetical protein